MWENWDPLKKHDEKVKLVGEVRLEIQIKESTKTGQNGKTKTKRSWNNVGTEKKKTTREKMTVQLEEINQKVLTNEISTKGKKIKTKQNIPKQWKKILSTTGMAWHKNIPTTRRQRNGTILDESIATKKV